MKVKMLVMGAGPTGVLNIGSIVEVSAQEGKQMIDGKYAVEVVAKPIPAPVKKAGKKAADKDEDNDEDKE
jgi:hypothetical protein